MDDFDFFTETSTSHVLLIDSDHHTQGIVSDALSEYCTVTPHTSKDDALKAICEQQPHLIIIDTQTSAMGGHDFCQTLKNNDDTAHIPVIFLYENIDNVHKCYDAGAWDYLTKPFHATELKSKVQHHIKMQNNWTELKSMSDFSSNTAMTAMISMSEMGSMLEILKKFNECTDWNSLLQAIIDGLKVFDLHGAVMARTPQGHQTLTDHGPASELEISILEHMAGMDRIVHFKSRLSINYERINFLVTNMPTHDDDRCGRLRDHLAILAEAADVCAKSIISDLESNSRGKVIERTLHRITDALHQIDEEQRNGQINTRLAVDDMNSMIDNALMSIALSEAQENYLTETIRKGIDNVLNAQSNQIDMQNRLSGIVKELSVYLPDRKMHPSVEITLWTANMLTGVKILDDDHLTLINTINELVLEINHKCRTETIAFKLQEITKETAEHFSREESLMDKCKYINSEKHKAEHAGLLHEITELKLKLSQGTLGINSGFINHLQSWFIEHIKGSDKEFAQYMQASAR